MGNSQPTMKACPFCAEEIQNAAIKCRHCGSMLDVTDAAPAGSTAGPTHVRAKDHPSYGLLTLVAVIIPIIGIILGIVHLAKSAPVDKKIGEHLLAVSLLMIFLWVGVSACRNGVNL